LPYHVGSSTLHLALSDALARHTEVPTVWWHTTERPTLILGPGQKPTHINLATCEAAGVLVLTRQTGGTAIYAAAGALGLDIALPAWHPLALPDVVEAYRWLGEVWVTAAQLLGADARLVTIDEARRAVPTRPHDETLRLACFGTLSPYEVAVGDRKLVGLSQVRRRRGILLQAGIYLDFQAEELARALTHDDVPGLADALSCAAIGLREATGSQTDAASVRNAFTTSLVRRQCVVVTPGRWSKAELYHAEQRLRDDFGCSDRISHRAVR
jgi:lipoate-protein ligase A